MAAAAVLSVVGSVEIATSASSSSDGRNHIRRSLAPVRPAAVFNSINLACEALVETRWAPVVEGGFVCVARLPSVGRSNSRPRRRRRERIRRTATVCERTSRSRHVVNNTTVDANRLCVVVPTERRFG